MRNPSGSSTKREIKRCGKGRGVGGGYEGRQRGKGGEKGKEIEILFVFKWLVSWVNVRHDTQWVFNWKFSCIQWEFEWEFSCIQCRKWEVVILIRVL